MKYENLIQRSDREFKRLTGVTPVLFHEMLQVTTVANAFPCQNTRIRAIKRSSLTLPKARLNVPKKQRQYYSGKKKRHTVKIQVIYGRETEKIISIQTGMGAQHDMRLAKKHLAELYPYKKSLRIRVIKDWLKPDYRPRKRNPNIIRWTNRIKRRTGG